MKHEESLKKLSESIRDVPDFPKPGILFKDITTMLQDGAMFQLALDEMAKTIQDREVPDKIVGIDARGFIFGAALAARMGCGFVPVRKKGKLPWRTLGESYALEYGESEVEAHEDSVLSGEKIWLVDDLLATGGTAEAALKIISKLGGELIGATFFIELAFLSGRARIESLAPVHSVIVY